jgi:hypothetical protein
MVCAHGEKYYKCLLIIVENASSIIKTIYQWFMKCWLFSGMYGQNILRYEWSMKIILETVLF